MGFLGWRSRRDMTPPAPSVGEAVAGAGRSFRFRVWGHPTPAPRTNGPMVMRHEEMLWKCGYGEPALQRYFAYCSTVRAAFLEAFPTEQRLKLQVASYKKPFLLDPRRRGIGAVVLYWLAFRASETGTCRHGDPDNCGKSIIDALFVDDQHVLGRCEGLDCATPADEYADVEVRVY